MKKRLAIFTLYNSNGLVEDYVVYLLKELDKIMDKIIIVSNGNLIGNEKKKIEKITKHILIRENKGFDVWGFKVGIDYLGWKNIEKYYSMTLLNDTIYGPLIPIEDVYSKMEDTDFDFWGITKGFGGNLGGCEPYKGIPIPPHIQSYFITFNNNILGFKKFQDYWNNLEMMSNKLDAVYRYEIYLTQFLKENGFLWDVFVDQSDLDELSPDPLLFSTEEVVKYRECPFIKKRIFYSEYYGQFYTQLHLTSGKNIVSTFNYINKNCNYDTDLIIKNLLNNNNLSDIKNVLHFNYIIPSKMLDTQHKTNKNVALFMHIDQEYFINKIYQYAKNMPSHYDMLIVTSNEQMKNKIQNIFKNLHPNKIIIVTEQIKFNSVSSSLHVLKSYIYNYDYICFIKDEEISKKGHLSIEESLFYRSVENLIKNSIYAENVINTFESDNNLGLLFAPPPYHGQYEDFIGNEWDEDYNNVVRLLNKLNVNVPIDLCKEPIFPLDGMLWFRTKAILDIFNYSWEYEESINNSTIYKTYSFISQKNGYYSGYIMNDQFASLEYNNLRLLLRNKTNLI